MRQRNRQTRARRRDGGFTLPELLAVVVILAILATIAVPAMSRDNIENRFAQLVTRLAQDLREAKIQSLSKREPHALRLIDDQSYDLSAVAPDGSFFLIRQQKAAPEVKIAGSLLTAATPGATYTAPTSFVARELRFARTGQLQVYNGTSWVDTSATIFLQSDNRRYEARIVVIGPTGHIRMYKRW